MELIKNSSFRVTDWKNQHLWHEGYRMKVAMLEFVENIMQLTGLKFHFHIHTPMKVPVITKGTGQASSFCYYTMRARCRCDHELPGHPESRDFWYE